MKALVTGGTGFIGSNLAKALEARKFKVWVLDDFSSGHFKNLIGFKGEVITGDISQRELWDWLRRDFQFDVVFHQAAITDTTLQDQRRMMLVNADSMRFILESVFHWRAKLIYASSAGVYGNSTPPMREEEGLVPENIYGFSKLTMDRIALSFIEEHPEVQVVGLRYFNVYGPGESYKGKTASMVYQLYLQMKAGRRPKLFKWGEQRRDFVYIEDIIRANLLALEKGFSGIFNVATGQARSFNEMVSILNRYLGTNLEPEYFDCPYDFYQNYTQADLSKAKEKLGYEPAYNLEEGIREYLERLGESTGA
ncbi:MAG: ADP-glyceromanno-heptose 6-epimerase [Acidobacteria bacterium]|jgi:ADP-L-glycero-D-manno-heptose 6-epimerase|nr:MAG: ADP-glyceromanno-heptose 6-epimerase [Acidobacteriota bacterium]